MTDAQRAKQIYELFCKLQTRNTVNKRGRVITRNSDAFYSSDEAIKNFFSAILRTEEQTALERVILVALRDLSQREVKALRDELKVYYLTSTKEGILKAV